MPQGTNPPSLSWLQPGRDAVVEQVVRGRDDLATATDEIRQCFDYWAELAAERRALPSHRQIRPNRISRLLSRFVLVELRPGGEWMPTYRLAGTEFERIAGRSLTGRKVSELFDPGGYARLTDLFTAIVADRLPRLQQVRLWFPGRDFFVVQRLFLPWSAGGGEVDFIGGVVLEVGRPGTLPSP
ncbi:PAS domain-containing protein [Marinibaculum pumilum]|uniref:PAS domain-containing protein n=1 Tax=Marinibaculum pumilum TaxID=1766165 RepID=A0ABV7KVR8_9PROT